MPFLNVDEVAPPSSLEPLGFRLGGADFECIDLVPAGRAAQLRDDMTSGARPALEVIVDFVEDVVIPADRARFAARILDTDDPVDPALIATVYLWLCQQYAERANPDGGTGALVPAPVGPASAGGAVEPDARRVDAVLRMGGTIG